MAARETPADVAPPAFLQLAGHPLRWQLLRELARSDRQVRELTDAVGERQSLVSYHLGRLREAALVSMRRSSADRRDTYYSIDLARCGELLAATGEALHAGLALAPPEDPMPRRHPGRRARVLFLCTGNSTRSQIAEALARHLAGDALEAESAGSRPRERVHPHAVRVMRERGIDISSQRPKHLDQFARRRFDVVVTLCDRVREVCPEFPGSPQRIHWSIADPAEAGGAESYPAFARTAAEIEQRVRFLLHAIERQYTRR